MKLKDILYGLKKDQVLYSHKAKSYHQDYHTLFIDLLCDDKKTLKKYLEVDDWTIIDRKISEKKSITQLMNLP